MAFNLAQLTRIARPEPALPDVSQDDPEITLRKEQHRTNSRRAHFWGKVSQLTFWAMTATLIGSGAVAGILSMGGVGAAAAGAAAVASYSSFYISLAIGATMGAISLISSNIENKIRVDNSLNFEEIHAKNVGRHTGEEVARAIQDVVASRQQERRTETTPAIPVSMARDTSAPVTRITANERNEQGTVVAPLPNGITLH
ncbi:MAG: hypothetical protein K2Q12_01955 [Rickettsiales bacterium]|nr:hypothetical protein [Rickettsiales bacterium]